MHRLGLALSGGGFRATLYHLGVVRFLRDAQILPHVSHITAVSGGSILGAHLALNWDQYCGSDAEFEEAADEIFRYVKLDVRNRIVRRFPFASAANMLLRMSRLGPSRRLTRAGLLEQHYEQFLYGDKSLFQLPDRPRLHILATNLSEGCLCSFDKQGLLLQRRVPGRRDRFQRVHLGLATVPTAVAASSAFPGFFPPLEISGWDVGADVGEFDRQAFTDGGVYDNLGLRMFRCIEQSRVREVAPLSRADFLAFEDTMAALHSAKSLPANTPLRSLAEKLSVFHSEILAPAQPESLNDRADIVIERLWDVIRNDELFREPSFQHMELSDPSAQSLLNFFNESRREPELNDHLWLNRQIVDSALSQAIGKPCLRASRQKFDGILVSDSGGKFKVATDTRAGGLLRTSLRASDILMDRVWQLELEAFENSTGLVYIPISDVVSRSQDRFAPHPEIQRQAARIRTDMDRFSNLEIAALVQHGYCVARKACRAQSNMFEQEIPTTPPWGPSLSFDGGQPKTNGTETAGPGSLRDERLATDYARRLRNSSKRRIWSSLLNFRDWPTYVWVPLMILLAFSFPYSLYRANTRARQQNMLLMGIAEMSPVYRRILTLIQEGPTPPEKFLEFADVESLPEQDFTGFEFISDTRVFDLRSWSRETSNAYEATSYTRVRIRRTLEGQENTRLRFRGHSVDDKIRLHCGPRSLNPTLLRMLQPDGKYLWSLELDFSHVPIDGDEEIALETILDSNTMLTSEDEGRFFFTLPARTGLVQVWMLMPESRAYHSFEVRGFPIGEPDRSQIVVPDSKVDLPLGAMAMFQLINPDPNHRYECRWTWSDKSDYAE